MSIGETLTKWLTRVDKDQNLESLDQLDDNTMDGRRRWFRRQDLTPVLCTGRYNNLTKTYDIGCADPLNILAPDNTSIATTDWVVTDGQVWDILAIGADNETQGSLSRFYYSPDAGTTLYALPGAHFGYPTIGAIDTTNCTHPVRLTGDGVNTIVRAVLVTWGAANVTKKILHYRRIS